jgi:phospholipase/carboxylesterase
MIISGTADPIVPLENAKRLGSLLTAAGAKVEHRVLPEGHGLSEAGVTLVRTWLNRF